MSLNDLRTELATLRKKETSALEATTAAINRDLEIAQLKFKEDFNNTKTEIQLEMNNRKGELQQDKQRNELLLQEVNHRLTINMSQLKTDMESMKLQLITTWASGWC